MDISKRKIGDIGEIVATKYLQKNSFQIIETNYQIKGGEIDIIAKDENQFVFIEVKYRRGNKFGTPEDALTKTKKKNILYTIKIYCLKNKVDINNVRFDFLAITDSLISHRVKHYKNISLY
ncbi:MAG: YraN family protein [Candidatus Gracilibacteria bacterium]|nr:YraN family protein [Candidatus Gracilibacteria bacterium]MDD2908587.1 YraN family protein [Candidatus Gracilibacteria bacterium]